MKDFIFSKQKKIEVKKEMMKFGLTMAAKLEA